MSQSGAGSRRNDDLSSLSFSVGATMVAGTADGDVADVDVADVNDAVDLWDTGIDSMWSAVKSGKVLNILSLCRDEAACRNLLKV